MGRILHAEHRDQLLNLMDQLSAEIKTKRNAVAQIRRVIQIDDGIILSLPRAEPTAGVGGARDG